MGSAVLGGRMAPNLTRTNHGEDVQRRVFGLEEQSKPSPEARGSRTLGPTNRGRVRSGVGAGGRRAQVTRGRTTSVSP